MPCNLFEGVLLTPCAARGVACGNGCRNFEHATGMRRIGFVCIFVFALPGMSAAVDANPTCSAPFRELPDRTTHRAAHCFV